jgi:hypothetical protein
MTVVIGGMRKAMETLGSAGPAFEEGIWRGLFRWGVRVMGEAKELAPVDVPARDLDVLRESGYLLMPFGGRMMDAQATLSAVAAGSLQEAGERKQGVMGFGGPRHPYAARQHDDPALSRKRVPGKEWKYLKTPLLRLAPQLQAFLKRAAGEAGVKLRARVAR